jgi:flagellar hook-basal body complex protein FliE
MSPIPSITSNLSTIMPNVDAAMPEATPLPTTNGIEMPSELSAPMSSLGTQPSSNSFASMLGQFVSDVNTQSTASAQAVNALQSGQNMPLHQAVIAMEEANVSFQLMVEVRNRLLDSYQEVMRMQM